MPNSNLKKDAPLIELDKRIAALEHNHEHDFKFMHSQLNKMEEHVMDISKSVQSIRDQFSAHMGGVSIKNKIWVVVYSFSTVLITLIAAIGVEKILKHFGFNL